MGWLSDSPRAIDFMVEPAVVDNDVSAFPAIGLAFKGNGDEMISVTLLGTPKALRLFARQVQRACNVAEDKARERQVQLNHVEPIVE